MKARVVKEYIDKHTQEFHAVGELVSLTDERFTEITRVGRYVEEVEPDEGSAGKAKNFDNVSDSADWEAIEQVTDQEAIEKVVDSADREAIEPEEAIEAPKKSRRSKR